MLSGLTILITAGPTYEPIDPIRFIGNYSSGKMGFALAQAATELVAGPVSLATPTGVTRLDVHTAQQMCDAVLNHVDEVDILIAAAAVADYRPVAIAKQKIKKTDESLTLNLVKNPDILATVAARANKPMLVGFAAESGQLIEHAQDKLERKQLAMIVANDITCEGMGFGADRNQVTLLTENTQEDIGPDSKYAIAKQLLDRVYQYYASHGSS